jgi:benzylsuccinate CoA-transferase BbsF subunit
VILARLVAISVVFYEINASGTVEKLGLTYEWARAIRPDLIYVRAPAFAATGTRKDVRGVGPTVEAFLGHTLLRGYEDLDPTTVPVIAPSDAFGGLSGALSVLVALTQRLGTGTGQLIEVPQAESCLAMFAEAMMDYSLNQRVQRTVGNRDIHGAAPSGVYPCRGDDRWIAITVTDDEEWSGLCAVMSRPELAADERFDTPLARHRNQDAIDDIVGAWSREHDANALMWELQRHGVPAGPVMDAGDCYRDAHLAERRYFETIHHPETGTYSWPGMPYKMSATPLSIRSAPRGLGEDNEYVYKTLLGVTDEEYAALQLEGHIGEEFDPEIP